MNELVVADRASEWRRLKALVLDSVSSPITRHVYNLGLDDFIAWYTEEPRSAGFTKATVTAKRRKPRPWHCWTARTTAQRPTYCQWMAGPASRVRKDKVPVLTKSFKTC
jgi:hypothetical protein